MPNTSRFPLPKSPKPQWVRVVLASLACLVIVFIVLFFTAPNPSSDTTKEHIELLSKNNGVKKLFKEELNKDDDNDGLKNWEEAVYHTDIKNPDTDGDKTPDGEEVRTNRNPLVKGPNDKVLPAEENPAVFVFDDKNLTHLFTQKLSQNPDFQKILSSQGGSISPDAIESYINELPIHDIIKEPTAPDPSILRIISDESAGAIARYFDSLAALYTKNEQAFTQGDDLTIFKNALETNDPNEWKKLSSMVAALDAMIREANLLQIPKNILWFHQQEVVLLAKTKNEITALANASKDPIGSLAAMQSRVATKEALTKLHKQDTPDWLSQHSVILTGTAFNLFGKKMN